MNFSLFVVLHKPQDHLAPQRNGSTLHVLFCLSFAGGKCYFLGKKATHSNRNFAISIYQPTCICQVCLYLLA